MTEARAHDDPAGPDTPPKRGPGRPRSQPLEMQRRAVLDAALPVFANQGYHGATIETIARGCGIPRPTVYEIFGGKDALFAAVLDDAAERVYGRLSASFAESGDMPLREFLRHSFTAVFDLFEQDRDAVTVLLNAEHSEDPPHPAPSEVRRRLLHDVAALTRSRWEALGVEVGDAAEVVALLVFRMAEGLALRRANDPTWDREALIDLLTEFTFGGIDRLWSQALDVLVAAGRRHRPGAAGA